jgi:hypothetical protein
MQHGDDIPLRDLLDKAIRELEAFDRPIEAIVGYWDLPVSSMVPILNDRFGLRSASLEAVLRCDWTSSSRVSSAGRCAGI